MAFENTARQAGAAALDLHPCFPQSIVKVGAVVGVRIGKCDFPIVLNVRGLDLGNLEQQRMRLVLPATLAKAGQKRSHNEMKFPACQGAFSEMNRFFVVAEVIMRQRKSAQEEKVQRIVRAETQCLEKGSEGLRKVAGEDSH